MVVHIHNGILFSHKKGTSFKSLELRWMNLESVIQGEVSQKEKNIYINEYTWKIEKWN